MRRRKTRPGRRAAMAMILRADLRRNAESVCGSEEASGGDGDSLA